MYPIASILGFILEGIIYIMLLYSVILPFHLNVSTDKKKTWLTWKSNFQMIQNDFPSLDCGLTGEGVRL